MNKKWVSFFILFTSGTWLVTLQNIYFTFLTMVCFSQRYTGLAILWQIWQNCRAYSSKHLLNQNTCETRPESNEFQNLIDLILRQGKDRKKTLFVFSHYFLYPHRCLSFKLLLEIYTIIYIHICFDFHKKKYSNSRVQIFGASTMSAGIGGYWRYTRPWLLLLPNVDGSTL